jgi:ligand-binding SRPBCC domain-containing protein
MMQFKHQFRVQAPLDTVHRFHQSMTSFRQLTPPPIIVQLHQATDKPEEGDRMDFTLWLGPIPVRWLAEFSQVSEHGFVDSQLRGPFKRWVHQHRFHPHPDGSTVVEDLIEAEVGWSPYTPIAAGMWLGMPLLFAYRAWMTKRALNSGDKEQGGVKDQ